MAVGGTIKVTAYMAGRWVKAAFLVILGIVLMLYSGGLVDDLRGMVPDEAPGDVEVDFDFETIWELLTVLIWILVAWLFVLAAINIALSFQDAKYSLAEVMRRLDRIDAKLGIDIAADEIADSVEEEVEAEPVRQQTAVEEEVPPPPRD